MGRLRRVTAAAFGLLFVPAAWGQEDWPAREVDRPLVLLPGMTEAAAGVLFQRATQTYDSLGNTGPVLPGQAEAATTGTGDIRYGLFQDAELYLRQPWTAISAAGVDGISSGVGRTELGGRYQREPMNIWVAGEASIILPDTARQLRTDPDGTVHYDHLALEGALRGKGRLAPDLALRGEVGLVFPFANQDDLAAQRTPPATFWTAAGVLRQLSPAFFGDLGLRFTRTNRDRVAGGVVPSSEELLFSVEPTAGWQPSGRLDLLLAASLPILGRNTPQAVGASLTARLRF